MKILDCKTNYKKVECIKHKDEIIWVKKYKGEIKNISWNVGTLAKYTSTFEVKNLITDKKVTLNIQTGSNAAGNRKYILPSGYNAVRFNGNYLTKATGLKFVCDTDLYILLFNMSNLDITLQRLDFSEVNGGIFVVNMNGITEAGNFEMFDLSKIDVDEVLINTKNLAGRTPSSFEAMFKYSNMLNLRII